jgi:hypothetical protein
MKLLLHESCPKQLTISNNKYSLTYAQNSGLETEIPAVGIRHADHVAPSIRKSSLTSGGHSQSQDTEFSLVF